jgi:hypothetical protein
MDITLSTSISTRKIYNLLAATTLYSALLPVSMASDEPSVHVMPQEGKLICSTLYRHNVPLTPGNKEFVMVTSGKCQIENGSSKLTHEYVMSLKFSENGVGDLITGMGFNLYQDQPISTHTMTEATYTLEFTDGNMSGWTAVGALLWNVGHYSGQSTQWQAYATGPESLVIEYKIDR